MEKAMGITKARQDFSQMIEHVQYRGDSYIINRHGTAAAVVVPLKVYENWKQQRKRFFDTIRQIQEANEGADPEQVMKDIIEAQQALRAPDRLQP